MNKAKKRGIILGVICLVILVGAFIADSYLGKSYFVEIKYNEVMKKIENKESFVLLLSQTTCSHCAEYKPKLTRVSKKYKVKITYLKYTFQKTVFVRKLFDETTNKSFDNKYELNFLFLKSLKFWSK